MVHFSQSVSRLSALGLLFAAVSAYEAAKSPTSGCDFAATGFDFIIVGGGTSGLVVANRLTENPDVTVGVLEAGTYRPGDFLILTPGATGPAVLGTESGTGSQLQGNTSYDWMFNTEPQTGLDNAIVRYPSGKVVGGSSAINTMVWMRASASEYDLWGNDFGNGDEWTWDGLLPYFMKTESWTPPPLILPSKRALPISLAYDNWDSDIEIPVVSSANALGIPTTSNPDAGNGTGILYTARVVNPITGERSYAGNAYYEPFASRPNLKLISEATVTKVLFNTDGPEPVATGVEFLWGGESYTANSNLEVILSAGTILTPKLLELSGVGNATILESFGIDVVLDSPYVGENFHDHCVTYSDFQLKNGLQTLDWLTFNTTFATAASEEYASNRTGPLSYTNAVNGPTSIRSFTSDEDYESIMASIDEFINTTETKSGLHAAQIQATKVMAEEGKVAWVQYVVVPQGGIGSVAKANTSYATTVVILTHPLAQGNTHIQSTNITESPSINPHFAENNVDINVLAAGSKFIRQMMEGSGIVEALSLPSNETMTEDDWMAHVRSHMGSTAHYLGTAAMAPQEMGGVVSNSLKVYGLANVRVVDASVFPFMLSVPILQSVYAVAEKASDIIKRDYGF
ncbi:alcohol oxidase [Hymenopellis radicata]|nr:alcohol oxidase [Hymenopellis radicata]